MTKTTQTLSSKCQLSEHGVAHFGLLTILVMVISTIGFVGYNIRSKNNSYAATISSPQLKSTKYTNPQSGFQHPGVFLSSDQLEDTRNKLKARDPVLLTALKEAQTTRPGRNLVAYSRIRVPHFDSLMKVSGGLAVECGPYNNPDRGCSAERVDAVGAYTQALLWYYTGNKDYARRATGLLNQYADKLMYHKGENSALQAAWTGDYFVRAAEIIRYTYVPNQADEKLDVNKFNAMLQRAFLPNFRFTGDGNPYSKADYVLNKAGNWDLATIQAYIQIAVFMDNRQLYNDALARWRARVPAYIYLSSDGASPKLPPGGDVKNKAQLGCFWLNAHNWKNAKDGKQNVPAVRACAKGADPQLKYQNGQAQETCRDFWHTSAGISSALNTAATARIQGTDLFAEQKDRLMAAITYHLQIAQSKKYPSDGFCGGVLKGKLPADAGEQARGGFISMLAYSVYVTHSAKTVSVQSTAQSNSSSKSLLATLNESKLNNCKKGRHCNSAGLINAWVVLTNYH